MAELAQVRIRRLLVGVDERPQAENPVRAGIHLARALGAELDLVHALPLPEPLRGVESIAHWVETTARIQDAARAQVLANIRGAFAEEAPRGLDGEGADQLLDIVPGQPARVLAAEVVSRAADLIVLGGHGRHAGLETGNTARSLLASSDVPVWVQTGPWQEIGRLLVPIDVTPGAERVLALARTVALALQKEVEVLHTWDPPFFAYDAELPPEVMPRYVVDELREEDRSHFDALASGFPWGEVRARSSWAVGRPAEIVLQRAKPDDLIVMGTHGRGAFLGRFLGSEAWTVLGKARASVLVVPLHPRTHAE